MHHHSNQTIQPITRCSSCVADFIDSQCLSRVYSLIDRLPFCRAAVIFESIRIKLRARTEKLKSVKDGAISNSLNQATAWISIYLREPRDFARTALIKNSLFIRQLEHRRNTLMSRRRIRAYCNNFRMPQRQQYLSLLSRDRRSRILVSYHFGDYVYGINFLVSLESPCRKRYVLSHQAAPNEYYLNIRRGLGANAVDRSSELLSSDTSITKLSLLLRKPDNTLVLFCDLPTGFGEPVEVSFLNRLARFPKGPATLAIINNTPLLPVINFFDGKNNQIEFSRQIEPRLHCDESLQSGIARITQELVSFFESFLHKYPEQWRYLSRLPIYFNDG